MRVKLNEISRWRCAAFPTKKASQEEPSLRESDSLAGAWQQVQLGPVLGALMRVKLNEISRRRCAASPTKRG
jgi:hypothetical protein